MSTSAHELQTPVNSPYDIIPNRTFNNTLDDIHRHFHTSMYSLNPFIRSQ